MTVMCKNNKHNFRTEVDESLEVRYHLFFKDIAHFSNSTEMITSFFDRTKGGMVIIPHNLLVELTRGLCGVGLCKECGIKNPILNS